MWQELDGGAAHATGPAVYVYLFFAWVLLPVFVPVAIMLLEPPGHTRRRIAGFVAIGDRRERRTWPTSLVTGDVSAHSGGHVVLYGGAGRYADAATALYIIATCGAPLRLAPPDHRLVRDRQPRRRRGHRRRPGRGPHVDLVLLGRRRQRAHLLPTRRVAERRAQPTPNEALPFWRDETAHIAGLPRQMV